MAKRQITAHKGNRTVFVPGFRATEETAAQIATILKRRKLTSDKLYSLGDWIAEKAAEEIKSYGIS